MYNVFKLPIICFLITSSVFAQKDSKEHFELKAGNSIMKISPKGGRIISYKIGKKEILTQASEHENFGSTLWTAPQSDWGWPPFSVLDDQDYQVEDNGSLLKMISKLDLKSGFQVVKTWKVVGNQEVKIEYQIRNISDKPQSVGAWVVSRVPCGGLAFFPDGGDEKVPESNLKTDFRKEGINWVAIDKKPIEDHQKLFSTAKEGWLAYLIDGLLFIKQFPDTKPENYSPQQGEVEIYINKEKSYAELENHGPYQLLQPGGSLTYLENWFLIQVPPTIKVEYGSKELCDLVRAKITEK